VRAVFEIRPPAWGETLAILQSVSLRDGPEAVRARVVDVAGERVTIDFPALDGETSAEQLLASCVAGEWADRGDVESCRLVGVEWPEGLPGPAFPAQPGVSVGAIVKPALGCLRLRRPRSRRSSRQAAPSSLRTTSCNARRRSVSAR
jgi:hypothetical protein